MALPAYRPLRDTAPQSQGVPRALEVLMPRRPARRDINYVLNLILPWILVLSFASGWMASWMGLTEFGLHKYSSIAVFVVAGAHLALHWRSLAAHIRRLLGSPRAVPPKPVLRLVEPEPVQGIPIMGAHEFSRETGT